MYQQAHLFVSVEFKFRIVKKFKKLPNVKLKFSFIFSLIHQDEIFDVPRIL